MKLNIISDPALVYDRLNAACSLNAPADVRVFKGKIAHTYKSRLFEIETRSAQRSVLIDIPTEHGRYVALGRGAQIEVHFATGLERFLFEAQVQGKSTFTLATGNKVRVLAVSYPDVLENSQRRAYYRVSPPSSSPVPVRMTTFKHKKDGKWTYEERFEAVRANLVDISAGGIAVRVPKSQSHDINTDTRLKLAFKLAPDEDEIKLTGMVRHCRDDFIDKTMRLLGIQFVDVEDSPEGRRYVDRIFAFVAQVQRQQLAAIRGQN
jgi:c-di-GMP-binding flagellar brake protein YcgR